MVKKLSLFIAVATTLACAGAADLASTQQAFDATRYAGTYSGTWNNATFGSSGASSLLITANAATKTGTAMWDLDGNVLGQSNPPAETFNGTYTDDGFTFGGTSATFGTFQISVNRAGQASGSATGIPNAAISRVDFGGTVSETAMNLTYTVTFSAAGGGGTATGTVSMTKQ